MNKIILIWLFLGLIGYILDQYRTKRNHETPISFFRGFFGGLFTLLGVWVAPKATPVNNEIEDSLY